MRKLFWLCLLFISAETSGQADTSQIDPDSSDIRIIDLPDSSAIGAPDGILVSKEIGPSGGTIISDDGRVELIFPEGALSSATTISIQPSKNLLPNGSRWAYQFEPSGIKFLKPVELLFHYSKEDEDICPPELMFMALQNHNGKWEYLDYEDWDSTNRALKGFITHFSAVVNGNLAELVPGEEPLRVGESRDFSLHVVSLPDKKLEASADGDEDELPALPPMVELDKLGARWSVNDIVDGNAALGKIVPQDNKSVATYHAPMGIPNKEITIELKTYIKFIPSKTKTAKEGFYHDKRPRRKYLASFKSRVQLFDLYEIVVTGLWDNLIPGQATERFKDTSSVMVEIRLNGSKAIDIKNSLFFLEKQFCPEKCLPCEYANRLTCNGPVHIAGIKAVVLEGSPSPFRSAIIYFENANGTIPEIQPHCPGIPMLSKMLPKNIPALPIRIKFDFKEGEQQQKIEMAGPSSYKYLVVIKRTE